MTTDNQQAVVETTDAQAKPAAEGANAQDKGDELDALLSQYDSESKATTTEPDSKPEQKPGTEQIDPKAIAARVRAELDAETRYERDMGATIKTIRGELDPEVFDDALLKGWINSQAEDDPRLQTAWKDRHKNPQQFAKVQEQLAKKFAAKFSKLPDRAATEEREAVTAAVRGASHKAPEGKAPDYSRMSNAEYREAHFKEHGYYPGV